MHGDKQIFTQKTGMYFRPFPVLYATFYLEEVCQEVLLKG